LGKTQKNTQNPEKYSKSGKILKIRGKKLRKFGKYSRKFGKVLQKNSEKYSEKLRKILPKNRIPEAKSLFPTMPRRPPSLLWSKTRFFPTKLALQLSINFSNLAYSSLKI